MRTRPTDLTDSDLQECLSHGWDLGVDRVEYAPVGGGSHHWLAHDAAARRYWLTVDALDDKTFLGGTRTDTFNALRCAFETALALRQAGLEFVVAPLRSTRGNAVERLGARHSLAVFPFVDGQPGRFGAELAPDERARKVDMLARLHDATAVVADVARPWPALLPARENLELALADLDQPWAGGPFSEPARGLLANHARLVRRRLAILERLADQVVAAGRPLVITHGEPHGANFIHAEDRLFLIDWDTVALGPPERDLWMVSGDAGDELARYTERSGRPINPAAIRLYRLRWLLDDISLFVGALRSVHTETEDMAHAWRALTLSLDFLTSLDLEPAWRAPA